MIALACGRKSVMSKNQESTRAPAWNDNNLSSLRNSLSPRGRNCAAPGSTSPLRPLPTHVVPGACSGFAHTHSRADRRACTHRPHNRPLTDAGASAVIRCIIPLTTTIRGASAAVFRTIVGSPRTDVCAAEPVWRAPPRPVARDGGADGCAGSAVSFPRRLFLAAK